MSRDAQNNYLVAGLKVRSEIALPELVPCSPADDEPDVEIRYAPVPTRLAGATQSIREAEIAENAVLIRIPGVARYHVKNGNQILVAAEPGTGARELRLFLLGSAFGAIYFQRGFFPLHASVVVINGKAVAFAGDSGAGKSTMTAWMNVQGYALLCDDVCVIRFDDHHSPMAYPGFPRLKLWSDALKEFEIDPSELQRDHFRTDKYHLSISGRFGMDPVPLQHINVLQFSDSDSAPRIEDIQPAQAVHLLRNNTYRYYYISGLGLTKSHFLDCVRLAKTTGMHFLTRPRQHSAMAECQRLIEEQMQ